MNYPAIPREFFNGDCFDAYRILGAHPCTAPDGAEGWRFAVWAPGATAVEVCGGFDGWEAGVPMERAETGVWSAFIPGLAEGDLYKYRVHGADGSVVMRSDPYAFSTELRPGTASRLAKLDFAFDDHAWMERRDKCRNRPLNIYELHAGSWKHKPGSTQPDGSDGWYNYEELAKELIPWLLDHHFTHVELLPLAEHPFDGSWGYQTTGYFSVTSRYGTPAQFAAFVNACHRMGIGVIMDFVPVHFAANADALAKFDGTHLYEYDSDVGQSEWGTCNFNYYRREVCSFLNSAAALWMDVYHCDGIRMDAISRALTGPGAAGSLAVAEAFGPEFLTPEGAMDRRRMRELAFRDAGALKRLEACLHPLIGAAVTREFESLSASPIVIYDCPLLWRDDFRHPAVSRVLVIDASDDVRLSRIVSRPGLTEETARLMMKAQPPRSRILQCADDLIVNEDDEAALRKRLDALSRIWMAITR